MQETYFKVHLEFPQSIPSVAVTFTRFNAGLIMHLALQSKLQQGLQKMKFSLNHTWRFDSVALAWLSGLCQTLITLFIEILLYALVILSHDLIDVLTTFMALYVVSRLDEFFILELLSVGSTEITSRIIKEAKFANLWTVKCTTSHLGDLDQNSVSLF
jgi:ABC-type thiamin/hydroxymethylpyrimidine transport system permease subunit